MLKPILPALAGLALAVVTVGGARADPLLISSGVWAKFQQYKDQLKSSDDEYFAASTTGGFAWENDQDKAISECEQHSNGAKCVLFAHNDQILVDYRVQ